MLNLLFKYTVVSIHSHPLTVTDNACWCFSFYYPLSKQSPGKWSTSQWCLCFTNILSFQLDMLQTMLKMGECPTWSRWYCHWRHRKSSYRARTNGRTRRSSTRNTSSYRKEVDTWPPWTVGTSCLKCLTTRWRLLQFLIVVLFVAVIFVTTGRSCDFNLCGGDGINIALMLSIRYMTLCIINNT